MSSIERSREKRRPVGRGECVYCKLEGGRGEFKLSFIKELIKNSLNNLRRIKEYTIPQLYYCSIVCSIGYKVGKKDQVCAIMLIKL